MVEEAVTLPVEPEPRKRSGPPSRYRPKDRLPQTVTLTVFAKQLLNATAARTGESRSDVLEALLRRHAAELVFDEEE